MAKTFRLKLKKWPTGDTCPGCDHDGMTFTAQEMDRTAGGIQIVRGVLSCPACGWWDDLAFCFEYQVPENAISSVDNGN